MIFGVGAKGAVLAIGLAGAPSFGRLTQTLVAGVASRDYVAAARIAGVGRVRILLRHVLPNIAEPLIVNATIGAGGALLAFAGLSFLGLGVQSPAYDWGRLLYDGVASIYVEPGRGARARARASWSPGSPSTCSASRIAKGLGVGAIGSVRGPLPPHRRATPAATSPEPSQHPPPTSRPRPRARRARPVAVTFPGADGPIRPVRGVSFARPPRRGRRHRRRVRLRQVADRAGRRPAASGTLGRVDAGRLRLARHRPAGSGQQGAAPAASGTSLAMVFQDPMTSFNPTRRMGGQLAEVARQHQGMDRRAALARAVDRLRAVRIAEPERRAHGSTRTSSPAACASGR